MIVLGACVAACALVATVALAKSPTVTTLSASSVGPHSAALAGKLNPNDKPATYWFEYGTTTAYGTSTAAASLSKGNKVIPVAATLTGLDPNTTYHYRLVGSNSDGTVNGSDATFTTLADLSAPEATPPAPTDSGTPPSAPGPTDAPASPPAPVLGQSVNVAATVGAVVVRLPGATSAVPLQAATSVPVGTMVDTRQGAVTLTTALPGGGTQGATVHGGLFQVRQPASGRGMTELVLRGPKPTCGSARAATARRPPRKLWASDNHGRFRTRGSNAVATVRGTSWYMEDRCDGTYTRVKRGSVKVRDLRTGRIVVLRAGQSHLSPAAR
jgi:hypothetical protein